MTSTKYEPQRKASVDRCRFVLRLNGKERALIRDLLDSGLYGRNEREVVERLISRSLVELLKLGLVKV